MLSKNAIKEFQNLYRKEFGIKLSEKEATKRASRLLGLYKAVYSDPSFDKTKKRKARYDTNTMSQSENDDN